MEFSRKTLWIGGALIALAALIVVLVLVGAGGGGGGTGVLGPVTWLRAGCWPWPRPAPIPRTTPGLVDIPAAVFLCASRLAANRRSI